jgi:hypothetical protein
MKYNVELLGTNDTVLRSVVKIHNEEYRTNFTPQTYLTWILNRWFENKIKENPKKRLKVPT